MAVDHFDLGARIRGIRKAKNLTIKDVASDAGVTIGLISQIERNLANPSVKSLRKIADVLGVPIASFFSQQPQNLGPVVRKGEQRQLENGQSGVSYYQLTPDNNRALEMIYSEYSPGASTGEFLFLHAGVECCYVLEGTMRIILGNREYTLGPGDTISVQAMEPHRIENVGKGALKTVWALTPPPF